MQACEGGVRGGDKRQETVGTLGLRHKKGTRLEYKARVRVNFQDSLQNSQGQRRRQRKPRFKHLRREAARLGGQRALPGARPCPPAPRGPRSLGGPPMWPTWLTLPGRLHAAGLHFSLIPSPGKDSVKPPLSEHAACHSAHLCTVGTLHPPALRLALPHVRGSVPATPGLCLYRIQDGPDQYPITGERRHLTTGHKTPPE